LFIFALFYVRAYILRRMSGQGGGGFGRRNVEVLEQFAIARDRSFCLVKVAGKIYFVAFAGNTVTLLDSFDVTAFSEAVAESVDKDVDEKSFGAIMSSKMQAGNSLQARMTRKMARFFAARMGREIDFEDEDEA